MGRWRLGTALALVAMLHGCGGGGSSGSGGSVTPPPTSATPTPPPPPAANCSLRARQDWAGAQLREWYLFPETLPANFDPSPYSSVQAYIDALTAAARAQRRDRFFTYVTSIAEENAFYSSGASAGFGFRMSIDSNARRLFVAEAFEGAPALAAGIDRGTEILAIGTNPNDLRSVDSILAAQGGAGISEALGPATPGTSRVLRVTDAAGARELTIAKADYSIQPVSSRYGAKILADGARRVGYVNLRTFISTADPALRAAFASFRAEGVSEIVVDLRYNGGGLVSIAELMSDLLGANRSPSEVLSRTTFRAEKSLNNEVRNFRPQPQSVAPTRIAFIGTDGSASASELVINAFIPYLHANAALVGTNTYGKPVGQIALDLAACDDRLRVVAFRTENAARQGDYYDGLAAKMEASCRADDDLAFPMGDPRESSTRIALDYLAGRSCSPISTSQSAQAARPEQRRRLLAPERPTTAQREVPGLY